jgi:hypothetical protein
MYQLVLLALLVQALVSRVDAQFAGFEDDESPRRTGWTTPRAGAAEDESLTPKYSSKPEPKAPNGSTRYYYSDGSVEEKHPPAPTDGATRYFYSDGHVEDAHEDEDEDNEADIAEAAPPKRGRTRHIGADGSVYYTEDEDESTYRKSGTIDLMVAQVKRDFKMVKDIADVVIPEPVKDFVRKNFGKQHAPPPCTCKQTNT